MNSINQPEENKIHSGSIRFQDLNYNRVQRLSEISGFYWKFPAVKALAVIKDIFCPGCELLELASSDFSIANSVSDAL